MHLCNWEFQITTQQTRRCTLRIKAWDWHSDLKGRGGKWGGKLLPQQSVELNCVEDMFWTFCLAHFRCFFILCYSPKGTGHDANNKLKHLGESTCQPKSNHHSKQAKNIMKPLPVKHCSNLCHSLIRPRGWSSQGCQSQEQNDQGQSCLYGCQEFKYPLHGHAKAIECNEGNNPEADEETSWQNSKLNINVEP